MTKTITVKIPLIVGSNGKWCANGYSSCSDPDWGFMADALDSSGPADKDPIWPTAERKYFITAEVEVPDDVPASIEGTVELVEA